MLAGELCGTVSCCPGWKVKAPEMLRSNLQVLLSLIVGHFGMICKSFQTGPHGAPLECVLIP